MSTWPDKAPGSILDYSVIWTDWLDSDEIDTSTWSVPTGLTKVKDSKTVEISTVWLSGGTVGTTYSVVNTITTIGTRTQQKTVKVRVTNL
jgi:hypothetical protein